MTKTKKAIVESFSRIGTRYAKKCVEEIRNTECTTTEQWLDLLKKIKSTRFMPERADMRTLDTIDCWKNYFSCKKMIERM